MYLCYEKSTDELMPSKILEELINSKEVILFGAGRTGDYFLKILTSYHVFPKCFCDNYVSKQGTIRNGLPVLAFDDAMEKYPNAMIFITSVYFEKIKVQILETKPYLEDRIYSAMVAMSWEILGGMTVSEEVSYIKLNQKRFELLYEILEDKESRETLENLLNYRLTREQKYIDYITSSEETYFDKQIINELYLKNRLVFIDGGSFTGDSVMAFLKHVKEEYREIHCYEADKECIQKIEDLIKDEKLEKIILHKAALWNREEKLQFQLSGAGGSSISTKTDNTVEVDAESLDMLLLAQVDFIKLDIEGAEEKALEGMAQTIKRCQPILAISAYHKQDDFLVLSDFIRKTGINYKLYLRHYMRVPAETVLYAVPERISL